MKRYTLVVLSILLSIAGHDSWAANRISAGSWSASPSTTYSGSYNEYVAWTLPLTMTSDTSGLNSGTLTTSQIYVKGSTASAPGCSGGTAFSDYSISYSGTSSGSTSGSITVTPGSAYTSGSYYTICVKGGSSGIKTNNGNTMSATVYNQFRIRDYAVPYVTSVSPAVGGTTSSTSPDIIVTFSEAMDSSTVTSSTVSLYDTTSAASVSLSGPTWSSDSKTATFTPSSSLTTSNSYTVTLDGTQADTSSNLIDCTSHLCGWQFSVDNSAPTISSYTPNTSFVTTTTPTISVTFSEQMLASSITTSTITVKNASNSAISGSWSLSSDKKTATFSSSALTNGGTYTVTITTGVTDVAGNAFSAAVVWSFTVDTTAPQVSAFTPVSSATGISLSTPITLTFTEATSGMKTSTFTTSNITVNNGINDIGWTYTYDSTGKMLTINPTGGYAYDTTYTITMNSTVTDNAGNSVNCSSGAFTGGSCSWSFTTTGLTAASYSAYPSFMCDTLQPNVLIILDNSNSMDEDMVGNAVGSPKCSDTSDLTTCSRSVIARLGLIDTINAYADKMRIGLMSFKLSSASKYYLHNSYYFSSFNPKSYCPSPPAACTTYCTDGTAAALATCNAYCQAQNASFDATYKDAILDTSAKSSYCSLIYPKTNKYTDSNGVTVYGATPGTLYSSTSQGIRYLYAPSYSTSLYPSNTDSYYSCSSHTGTTDATSGYSGCSGPYGFTPTDDDYALGFYDFGARNYWYYTSRTWYSNSSPGGGYLHVPIAANDSANSQRDSLLAKLGLAGTNASTNGFKDDETKYMACTYTSDPNACSYIVNSGLTPTNGTLASAKQYFKGTLSQGSTTLASPIQYPCQKNYIIFVTDGAPSVNSSGAAGTASALIGDVVSTIAGLRCPSTGASSANCQFTYGGATYDIQTYVLGVALNSTNKSLVSSMATAGGTTAYFGDDLSSFNTAIASIFKDILSSASSGTAASILNNSQGSGAGLLQAMFYPMKVFTGSSSSANAYWIGEMHNLWYYIDTALSNVSIREDSDGNNQLHLAKDNIVSFYFDDSASKALVNTYADSNGDGTSDTSVSSGADPDTINSLWRAGRKLWERNLSSSNDPRTIYTGLGSTRGATPQKFSSDPDDSFVNSAIAWTQLQIPSGTDTYRLSKAKLLVNYIHGSDQSSSSDPDGQEYRSRTVPIKNCGLSDTQACSREWKLGDIVSSTPKLVSNIALGAYNSSAPNGYGDTTYRSFLATTTYKKRGMVFVGANDGMLHAFKLGTLKELSGKYLKAEFDDESGNLAGSSTGLGHEEWTFIPTGALPYLKYYADTGYDHIFYVDHTPLAVDASIGVPTDCSGGYYSCEKSASTWRTVLIGGMGFGGASRLSTGSCNDTTTVDGVTLPNCIVSPIATGGLSSYFALDVTDPANPLYLWEFAGNNGDLGAATTGPAIIRLAYRTTSGTRDNSKNGRWFAVFASGPTGPIYSTYHRFMGQSDQNLKIFIVDLADGTLVKTIDTGIANAFAGSLTSNVIDTDKWNVTSSGYYSDDVVYIGYVQKDATLGTWTKGGVLRLTTSDWIGPNDTNTSTGNPYWNLSTLIDGIGPVTTSVVKLQDRTNKQLWVYFGTGRFYYNGDDPSTSTTQALYGVKEPCYSTANRNIGGLSVIAGGSVNHMDGTCSDAVPTGSSYLIDQSGTATTSPSSSLSANASGWFVKLDAAGTTAGYLSERLISDPTVSTAGTVYFTTFVPNSSPCQYGGGTYIWALNYATGAAPASSTMKGTALVQVSTGAFQQVSLSSAFSSTSSRLNGRRTATAITGVPPTSQGMSLISNPSPIKKIIHVREK